MKKKIAVVTTNRADYDQIFWLISELKKDKKISLRLVVTGAHLEKRFGYSVNQIKKDLDYKSINTYKPTGNFVYDDTSLMNMADKFKN